MKAPGLLGSKLISTIDLRLILAAGGEPWEGSFLRMTPKFKSIDDNGFPNRVEVKSAHFLLETGALKEASLGDSRRIGSRI